MEVLVAALITVSAVIFPLLYLISATLYCICFLSDPLSLTGKLIIGTYLGSLLIICVMIAPTLWYFIIKITYIQLKSHNSFITVLEMPRQKPSKVNLTEKDVYNLNYWRELLRL